MRRSAFVTSATPRALGIRSTLAVAVVAVASAATPAPPAEARTAKMPGKPPLQASAWRLCADAVAREEARQRIPTRLLRAISLVESGQWNPQRRETVAWPWTIHADGKGRYFPSKRAAIAAVRALQARGVRNIDVGCMQVNLYYHQKAFPSLEAAFDPERNAAYAARFLTDLKREHRSWSKAVQHYHSATPDKRLPYQRQVYAVWRQAQNGSLRRGTATNKNRLRRAASQVERAHRAKLSAHRARKSRRTPATRAPTTAAGRGASRTLTHWPPRSVKAQRRAQNLARARAMSPSAGATGR